MKKKWIKRFFSFLLICSMLASTMTSFGDAVAKTKQSQKKAEQQKEDALRQRIASAVDAKKYPKGQFAFYQSQVTGTEGSDTELMIVRAGGRKGSASLTLKAIDVSAKYGEDYLMTIQEGKKKTVPAKNGSGETLMEKYKDQILVSDSGAVSGGAVSGSAISQQDSKASIDTGLEEVSKEDLRGMQKAAAAQNGSVSKETEWRELDNRSTKEYKEAEKLVSQGKKNVKKGAKDMEGLEITLNFKKGEYKKSILLSAIDDDLAESDEQVMFVMTDSKGAEISDSYTGYYNIRDNEEKEVNQYEMVSKAVLVKRGKQFVDITIKKTSGTEQMSVLNVGTSEDTAKPGEDYMSVNESLVFAAGVTDKTVSIPLLNQENRRKDVGFYVGIQAVDGVVASRNNSTYVTISGKELGSDAVYQSAEKSSTTDGRVSDTDDAVALVSGGNWLSTSNGSRTEKTIASGLDLRTAKSVTITYYSDEGSTNITEGSGCSAHTVTKRKRRIGFKLLNNNGGFCADIKNPPEQEQYGSSQNQETATLQLNDNNTNLKNSSMKVSAWVEGADHNNNATLAITSVKITYPDYKITMYNDKRNNEYNRYRPKLYFSSDEKKGFKEQSNQLRLGYAYFGGKADVTSVTVHKYTDSFSTNWAYDDTNKNDYGISPGKNTVSFDGYQVKEGNSERWKNLSGDVTLENLLKNYKDCMNNYEFTLRPKFSVGKTTLHFLNNGSQTIQTSENGKKENKSIRQSEAGFFEGFKNDSKKSVMLLDTVKITAKPRAGYYVSGFSTYYKKKYDGGRGKTLSEVEHEQEKTADSNIIMLHPSVREEICVDVNYQESQIEVRALPKGAQNADKGAVLYTYNKDGGFYSLSGDKTNPLFISNVLTGINYKIIGQQTQEIPSDLNGFLGEDRKLQYRAAWIDATLDADGDGDITINEQKGTNYKPFPSVTGNVLNLSPSVPYTKVYYDFVLREKVSNIAKQTYLTGVVSLEDSEIFTGKKTVTPINGVTVSADGDSDVTSHTRANKDVHETDGYYSLSGDGSYYTMDTMLVSYNYTSKDGSVLSANTIQNPGVSKKITIATDSVMAVDECGTCSLEKNKRGELEAKKIPYNSLTNDDNDYRVWFRVVSKNASKKAIKAVLRFYKEDGETLIPNTAMTEKVKENEDSYFYFDFNPDKLGLPAGTILKLQLYDQDDTPYYERKTGIVLMQKIGLLDFVNRFSFGGSGTVVKLLGKIDSAFDMGWTGKFDACNTSVFRVDENTGDLTFSLGFSKNGISKEFDASSVSSAAKDKAEAEEDYRKAQDKISKKKKEDVTESDEKKLNKLREKYNEAADKFEDKYDKASDPAKTRTNVIAGISLDIAFSLMINFKKDTEKPSYYFDSMTLTGTVNGGVDITTNFATPIGITISIVLSVGLKDSSASFIVSQRTDLDEPPKYYLNPVSKADNALIKDDKISLFDFSKSENNPFEHKGAFSVNPYVRLTAGIGPSDLLELTANGTAQFYMSFYTDNTTNSGYVNLSAGIGIKILFIKASWPFVSKNIDLFGNGSKASLDMEDNNYLYDSTDMFQAEDKTYLKNRGSWNDEKMSTMSLDENESGVVEAELQKGVYSGTKTQLMALDSGDYLGIFLDDDLDEDGNLRRESINSSAVYYSIYDHTEKKWSKPLLLEDDNTVDQDVRAFDLGSRGIVVTWSSANKPISDKMSRVDMLNAMDIHAAFFNKETKEFGEILEVTRETALKNENVGNDDVSEVSPNVVYNGNSMIVYYTKNEYDISDENEGEVVGDVVYPSYTLMAYRQYNFKSDQGSDGAFVTDYAELNNSENEDSTEKILREEWGEDYSAYVDAWYGQVFLETSPDVYLDEEMELGYWKDNKEPVVYAGHTVSSDVDTSKESGVTNEKTEVKGDMVESKYTPKIMDTDAISYNNLGLFAYTVDYDENMQTVNDRDVYMQLYDFDTGVMTHPIMVTSDNVADSNVKFTRVKNSASNFEQTYLTWLSDGNVVAMNMSNVIKNCLIEKQTEEGQNYYIIDKSSQGKYEPIRTLAQGDVNESVEGAISSITSYDVKSVDGYVYVTWTENSTEEREGAETNLAGMIEPENQLSERQIYMSRYDFAEGRSTEKVQVTSGEGANYDNISFVVNEDATVTALATKAASKLVRVDEFNETIDQYNKTADADSKQDKLTEDEFTEYTEADPNQSSLVELQITPVSVLKVEQCDLGVILSGENNQIPFTLLNDGLDTIRGVTLTVKDGEGKSVLSQAKDLSEDSENAVISYEPVDKIKIERLMGGERYQGCLSIPLGSNEKKSTVTFTLTDGDGKKVMERTYSQAVKESTKLSDYSVRESAERDVFTAGFSIENDGNTTSKKGKAILGIINGDQKKELASVEVPELERGEIREFSEELAVNSKEYFSVQKGEDGFITETGTFYITYGEETQEINIEREATTSQMKCINGIQSVKIADGKTMTIQKEETARAYADISSSLADKELGSTGAEGLDVIWETEDSNIATVTDDMVKGIKEGTTTLYAHIIPKASESIITVDERNRRTDAGVTAHNFGDTLSGYSSMPNDAIRTYSVKLTVTKAGTLGDSNSSDDNKTDANQGTTTTPNANNNSQTGKSSSRKTVTKKGITYKISGSSVKVSKAKKTITSAVIPSTVKINGKKYKVVSISKSAFKNCKKLKKVTIGSNVKTISSNAFMNCKKLKKIVFLRTKTSRLGKNAFKGIAAKAVFQTPTKALKKYKKVLKKYVGFVKKTMKVKKK